MRLFGYEFPSVTGLFGAPSVNEVQSRQGGIPFNPSRDGVARGWTYDPFDGPSAFGTPSDTGPSSGLQNLFALFGDNAEPPPYNWSIRDPRGYSSRIPGGATIPDETRGVSYATAPGGATLPDESGGVSYATAPGGATLPNESGGVSRGYARDPLPNEGGGAPGPEYIPWNDRLTQADLAPGDPGHNEYQRSQEQRFGRGVLGIGATFLDRATSYFER